MAKEQNKPTKTCSECSIVASRESNYCPNCGTKMDLEG